MSVLDLGVLEKEVGSEQSRETQTKPPSVDRSLPAQLLNGPRPKVQLPGDNRLLSEFAREVGEQLANVDLFRRDTYAVVINRRRDGLELMTPDLFRTWVERAPSLLQNAPGWREPNPIRPDHDPRGRRLCASLAAISRRAATD
jgi:hypothetical protein